MSCTNVQKNACRILYCCTVCAIAIAIITFSGILIGTFVFTKLKYDQVLLNWEQDPIVDIYMPPTNAKCQSNESPLFYYKWPGISSGCKCESQANLYKSEACCNTNGATKKCCKGVSVDGVDEKEFDLWDVSSDKSQSKTIRLCAKTLQNYNFKSKAPLNDECKSDEKRCGHLLPNQGDSSFLYCVPISSKCPIQEIKFATNNLDLEWELLQTFGLSTYSLYVKRTSNNLLPLSQLRVSNSQTTCWEDNQSYIPKVDITLDKRTEECTTSDTRFQPTLLSMIEQNYFQINNVKSKIDSIAGYTYNTQYPFMLLQKSYILLKMNCRSNIQKYYDNQDDLDNLMKFITATFALCLIYAVDLIFFETWVGFIFPKYLWGVIIFRRKANFFLKLIYILKFIVALGCIISCLILTVKYPKQNNFYKDELDKDCFDQELKEVFQNFRDAMYPGVAIACVLVLFLALCIEPNIWYLIIKCKNPNYFDKKKETQYMTNDPNTNQQQLQQVNQGIPIQQGVGYYPNQQPQYPNQMQYPNQIQYPNLMPQQHYYHPQQPYYQPGQPQYYPQQQTQFYPAQPIGGIQANNYPTQPELLNNLIDPINNPLPPLNPLASQNVPINPLYAPNAPLPPYDSQIKQFEMQNAKINTGQQEGSPFI